jgi:hypothetical protein
MIEVDNLRSNLHMSIYMKWPPPVESDVKHHSHHHPPPKKQPPPQKKIKIPVQLFCTHDQF